MILYNVYYSDGNDHQFKLTTDNPNKWLFKYNNDRIISGKEPISADNFEVHEINPMLFNEENKNGKI